MSLERPDIERLVSLERRLESYDSSLRLQAAEYERRLGELNHAYKQAQDERRKYVSIERFDGVIDRLEVWHRNVDSDLTRLNKQVSERAGKESSMAKMTSVVISLLALAVAGLALYFR